METSLRIKPIKRQHIKLVSVLETIQEDLIRLSGYVSQLSDLPNEQLETLDIEDQLISIHRTLKRFETHCAVLRIGSNIDEIAEPVMGESKWIFPKSTGNWKPVRREVKHANKLAHQLTESISKIRVGLSENQDLVEIPEDLLRINQTFRNVVDDFMTDDLPIHG